MRIQCSRQFGLGTKLPWDPVWVIESLSDSTIYMAFYTIAHLLQGRDNLDGSKVHKMSVCTYEFVFMFVTHCGLFPQESPLGISADQLDDDVFNYIYLQGPYPAYCSIPEDKLRQLRQEFEYWYPLDLRVSAKDLIPNHLTMCLYNHAEIWSDRPEMWPRSIYNNGHIMVDKEKMSKSKVMRKYFGTTITGFSFLFC